jgi:catechol 2,3-dioxygenase-like lactoylglutathione lyase family enzyme
VIKQLAHICIFSKDLAATEKFYCRALKLKKVFDFIQNGEIIGFYLQISGKSYIEVFRNDTANQNSISPLQHICFETVNMDKLMKQIKSEGYETTDKIMGADKSWQFWATDPDGVKIEFHEYTENSSQITRKDCVLK